VGVTAIAVEGHELSFHVVVGIPGTGVMAITGNNFLGNYGV
jgi:hypothetical protein